MVSYLFGLESMCYLTCGLVDRGVEDYSLESAICKVSGTEFLWYAANRAMQLSGGEGYMKDGALREDHARHPHLPDLRGRQRRDARLHRALRDEAGRREALRARRHRARRPDRLDRRALLDYVGGRIKREVRPDRITMAHPELEAARRRGLRAGQGAALGRPSPCSASTSRTSSSASSSRSGSAEAISDIYAQVAVLSRVTQIFEDQGVEPSGQERYIADTFCTRAAGRVRSRLPPDRVATTTSG